MLDSEEEDNNGEMVNMVEIEFEKDENGMRMNELFDGDEDEGVGSFSVGLN